MPAKVTILCVDDEPAVLYTTKLILEQAGYEVLTASNAAAAVSLVAEHRFDVLLLDCVPDRALLVQEARRRRPGALLLLLTGDVVKTEEADLDGVLHKPVPPPELLRTISTWLEKHTPGPVVPA
jgi:CheY-like chemotaxis protein